MDTIKITVVGDAVVGKTCLIHRFVYDIFLECDSSISTDREDAEITIDDQTFSVCLVEPATYENCDRFRPFYYKNSKAFILCYSIDDRSSFTSILYKWMLEFKNVPNWPIPIILVATKVDLRDDEANHKPLIGKSEGKDLARRIGAKKFIESSAKTNRGIKEVVEEALRAATEKLSIVEAENSCCCC